VVGVYDVKVEIYKEPSCSAITTPVARGNTASEGVTIVDNETLTVSLIIYEIVDPYPSPNRCLASVSTMAGLVGSRGVNVSFAHPKSETLFHC
jgi:hypothetical protein